MNISIKKGIGFGLTSGVITTLGLIIGLYSGIGVKEVIVAGILTIAIADAFSDALGVHISEESDKKKTQSNIWSSTFSTFFSKLIFALSFLIPILFLQLNLAIIFSIIWGLFLIVIFSYYIAKSRRENVLGVIFQHLIIAIFVILISYLVGLGIDKLFS